MPGLQLIANTTANEFASGNGSSNENGPYYHGGYAYYFNVEQITGSPSFTWGIVTRRSNAPLTSPPYYTTWPLVSPPSIPTVSGSSPGFLPTVANVSFDEYTNGDTHLLYAAFSTFDGAVGGSSITTTFWVYDFNANTWTSAAPSISANVGAFNVPYFRISYPDGEYFPYPGQAIWNQMFLRVDQATGTIYFFYADVIDQICTLTYDSPQPYGAIGLFCQMLVAGVWTGTRAGGAPFWIAPQVQGVAYVIGACVYNSNPYAFVYSVAPDNTPMDCDNIALAASWNFYLAKAAFLGDGSGAPIYEFSAYSPWEKVGYGCTYAKPMNAGFSPGPLPFAAPCGGIGLVSKPIFLGGYFYWTHLGPGQFVVLNKLDPNAASVTALTTSVVAGFNSSGGVGPYNGLVQLYVNGSKLRLMWQGDTADVVEPLSAYPLTLTLNVPAMLSCPAATVPYTVTALQSYPDWYCADVDPSTLAVATGRTTSLSGGYINGTSGTNVSYRNSLMPVVFGGLEYPAFYNASSGLFQLLDPVRNTPGRFVPSYTKSRGRPGR